MKAPMFDTMVVSYALRYQPDVPGDEKEAAAAHILKQHKVVRISSVTWAELCRHHSKESLDAMGAGRFLVEPFTAPMAELAGKILRDHRKSPTACVECFNAKQSTPCVACGNRASVSRKVNDAYIVATAKYARGVEMLFSFDGGIALLGELMKVRVIRPPHVNGPLFDQGVNPQLIAKPAEARP